MKKITVYIETACVGSRCEDEFEVDDDATEEEIEETAKEIAFDMLNWGYTIKQHE